MSLLGFAQISLRALAGAVIIGSMALLAAAPAEAAMSEEMALSKCHIKYVAPRIQDAMLALKATQYCVGQEFPYTELDVLARLDKLRCDAGASSMIDELYDDYDKQYRLVLMKDKTHTVCKHAATLHIK